MKQQNRKDFHVGDQVMTRYGSGSVTNFRYHSTLSEKVFICIKIHAGVAKYVELKAEDVRHLTESEKQAIQQYNHIQQ